jgi:hypothetical protein
MRPTIHQWDLNFIVSFTVSVKHCYSVVI